MGSVTGSTPASSLLSPTSPALTTELHPSETPEDDRWALAYINVAHLQSILEAVDDDSTGYVTIKEANDFTMSCPKGWRCAFLLTTPAPVLIYASQ
jgi:hypothetical protein